MGNDGGSIPTRRELVKEAARNPTATELKESMHEQQSYYWTTDPLTQQPLSQPVVSDSLGRLFNKESVLTFLLSDDNGDEHKRAEQEAMLRGTVKSLKDVVEVKFQTADSLEGKSNGQTNTTKQAERWLCPFTNKELGPGAKAVYIVPCGHAFAEAAVKEVSEEKCLQCDQPYAPNDVIPILPTSEDDISRLTLRMKTLSSNGLTHSLKKDKKRKKDKSESKETDKELKPVSAGISKDKINDNSRTATPQPKDASGGIQHAGTASVAARVLQEQEERNKKRKLNKNDNLDSLFSSKKQNGGSAKNTDFMTRGFSISTQQK